MKIDWTDTNAGSCNVVEKNHFIASKTHWKLPCNEYRGRYGYRNIGGMIQNWPFLGIILAHLVFANDLGWNLKLFGKILGRNDGSGN